MEVYITNKKTARLAGLIYLGVVLTGIISLMYVPSRLIVWDDPTLTFNNISTHHILYRIGVICGIICYLLFLFLPFILYKLFYPIDKNYALSMIVFAVISVPIYFINAQNQLSVISLISDSYHSKLLVPKEIKSQIMLYLNQYKNGLRIVHVFSGLWLFPFGYLVFKSSFLPRIFGVLLMLGCIGYLINFIGNTLFVNYPELGFSKFISLPASIGEIGICLWLLIVGTKRIKKT